MRRPTVQARLVAHGLGRHLQQGLRMTQDLTKGCCKSVDAEPRGFKYRNVMGIGVPKATMYKYGIWASHLHVGVLGPSEKSHSHSASYPSLNLTRRPQILLTSRLDPSETSAKWRGRPICCWTAFPRTLLRSSAKANKVCSQDLEYQPSS